MEKLVLRAAIHETPAALRFGGDGAFVTFAIAESDVSKAVALIALKKTPLKLTVEVEPGVFEGNVSCQEENHTATKRARR